MNGGLKATLLGSIGFRGAELQHFEPIDIYGSGPPTQAASKCDKTEHGSVDSVSNRVRVPIAAMGMTQPVDRKSDGRDKANAKHQAVDGLSSKHNSSQSKKTELALRQGNGLHGKTLSIISSCTNGHLSS